MQKTRFSADYEYPGSTVLGSSQTNEIHPNYDDLRSLVQAYAIASPVTKTIKANAGTIEYENDAAKFNPCLHVYDRLDVDPVRARHHYARSWFYIDRWYNTTWCGIDKPIMPLLEPDILEVTSEMRRRAWAAMYPEINDGAKLIVSIYEFRDFPRLAMSVYKLHRVFKHAVENRVINDPSKLISQLLLAYNFGFKPLVNDLTQVMLMCIELDKLIDAFIESGKEVQSYHYKEVLSSDSDETEYGGGHILMERLSMYYATCKMSYQYDRPPLWEAVMRVGGVRLSAGIVWEAIPWSFAIDWIVNLQKFFDQFDKDPRVIVKVHDYCDTIKSSVTNSYRRSHSESSGTLWRPAYPWTAATSLALYDPVYGKDYETPVWTWKRVRYQRTPGTPDMGYALPAFDSMSSRQLVLAGALLRAQLVY